MDEALNGYGDTITIVLEKDGSVSVEDYGRGMPVGMHASGVSTLQVIFTVLHAGGKFTSEGGYTFDEYNNPIKDAVIIKVTGGEEVFDRMF